MKQFTYRLLSKVMVLSVMFLSVQSLFADKIKVEKLDDLPRYTYKLDIKAVEIFSDDKVLSDFTKQVKKDLLSDLDTYDITDSTTLQSYYANLGSIALIESEWEKYLTYLNLRIDLETKQANRLTKGLVASAVVRAKLKGGDDFATVFRDEYSKAIASLPYEVVQDSLKASKGSAEIISTNLIMGVINERIQPQLEKSNGEMSESTARGLLASVFTLKYMIPLKGIIQQELAKVIAANHIEKEDIWAARDQVLTLSDGKQEVVLAVWDSGVDTKIFNKTKQLWINTSEKPNNGIDDDNNGFIDDVHGIAFTLHSDKDISLLYPIGELINNEDELRNQNKGLIDLQASIDSEEAKALREKLSNLKQDQVKPFIEDLSIYGNYAHGTHVAGIAAAGNPFARILVARITFGHTMLPETPTVEQAKKDALAIVATIEYFKANGVRAVNMSWGGSLAGIESALEANNAGGSAEQRKKLSREIYNIGDKAFREAIQNAPEILFIPVQVTLIITLLLKSFILVPMIIQISYP